MSFSPQLLRPPADMAIMPRRLLARMAALLDASPLPLTDPVRLDLEAELLSFLAAPSAPRLRRRVFVIEADARGEHDTLPN